MDIVKCILIAKASVIFTVTVIILYIKRWVLYISHPTQMYAILLFLCTFQILHCPLGVSPQKDDDSLSTGAEHGEHAGVKITKLHSSYCSFGL